MTQTISQPRSSISPIEANFVAYKRAAEKGLHWCLNLQNPDGSIQMEKDCFDAIYKFPATFVALGRFVEAGKLLNYLEKETLKSSGDLAFAGGKFAHEWHKRFHMYVNSWVIIGAQRAGFFNLAERCMQYFLKYEVGNSGGFQSASIENDRAGVSDTTITSQAGICCLYTGRHEQAARAAEALCRIAQQQEQGGALFYFCMDRSGQLVKEPLAGSNPFWTWIDSRNAGQCYWYLAIAAAFLCHMFELTGKQRYQDCARIYLDFLLRAKGSITSLASGKFGYASALMYRATGEGKFRDAALAHADWLVSYQKPDGRWMNDEPDYPWYFTYDCTAEMAFWLSEIMKILSAPKFKAKN